MMRPVLFSIALLSACYAAPPSTATSNKGASPQQAAPVAKAFKPFTGKVGANKVRVRLKPDLEGHILRQANKNDLLLVVGEEGDFYAVEPLKDTKAYVFRTYILDDIVEATRVNVRLEPHADAPIIGQLQAGDKVQSVVCPMNHKWLEVAAPKGTVFYVAKEYITSVGGPEHLANMERRKSELEGLLNSSYLLAETECKKNYLDMHPDTVSESFQTILRNFSDFPEAVTQAKEGLALLKETYLNKKIAFLESKAELSPEAKQELIAKHQEDNKNLFVDVPVHLDSSLWNKRSLKKEMTDAMRPWETLEEALYLSWTAFHSGKKLDDFYTEQRANASILTGRLESYNPPIKDKPGNYVLRNGESRISYLYSTHVDLENYVGKMVTLEASPRPNHHFAFPAYFVLSVE